MSADAGGADWVEVARSREHAAARDYALVLAAMGIPYWIQVGEGEVHLLVEERDAARARREIDLFIAENHERAPAPSQPYGAAQAVDSLLVYVAVLVLVHSMAHRGAWGMAWFEAGAAQAGLILQGEIWRTITALTLHSDGQHILSNLVFGSIFAALVAHRFGPGLGWLAVILAGAVGNFGNAVLVPATHTAVGASTGVFAAVGLMAAATWQDHHRRREIGLRTWAPLAAGAMLVAFIGVGGEQVDVSGHIAGFLAGVGGGMVLAGRLDRLPRDSRSQAVYAGGALGTLVLAWLVALSLGG